MERLENTLPGFMLALEHRADAVELDAHVTSDGVVVVHHDEIAMGHPIAKSPWTVVSGLDLGRGDRIPRLSDVLDAIGNRATVYVELKGARIENRVIEVVRAHGQRYAVHSFDHSTIERAASAAPDVARGVLIDRGTTNPIQAMRRAISLTRARDVWPHWSLVGSDMMRAADELGVRVLVWTVNSTETARHMASLGVAGICTDDVRPLANL